MEIMLLASLLFLGTHLGLSSTEIRPRLVALVGERGFLLAYSVVALASLSWLIVLYNQLPRYEYLWMPSPERYAAAKLLMPVALVFAVGGLLGRNPTIVGADGLLAGGRGAELARGMLRVTRHPFQWGVALWAVAHITANGDRVSVLFFATFLLLSGLGAFLIDRKKAARSGSDWAAYAQVTSNLPFAAIFSGRNRLVIRELWLSVALGLALYVLLYFGHEWVSGVRIV